MSSGMYAPNSAFHNHDGTMFVDTHIHAQTVSLASSSSAKNEDLLGKLPHVEQATFDHLSREGDALCLPNTRTEVLAHIMAWVRGGGSSGESQSASAGVGPHIYWLDGMAGTGKSTIARTVARRCADEGRLGASFFFARGGGELASPRKLVMSIAVQLAQHSPALRQHICDAVAAQPTIASKTLHDQWKQLVLRPLQKLNSAADDERQPAADAASLVVVIDALDECSDEREIGFVLRLLSETPGFALVQLKIFLTSRPLVSIREGMCDIPLEQQQHFILHHIEEAVVNSDIRVYFEHSLGRFTRKRQLPTEEDERDVLRELVERAGGLVIWAATTCRFVHEGGPRARRRLDTILAGEASTAATSPERRLDEIYQSVLRNALRVDFTPEETEETCSLLRNVLGSIAVMFSSLSAPSLGCLLDLLEDEVREILSDLHPIIDVPEEPVRPVRPQHASVRDYLLSKQRCTDARFWIDERSMHAQIATHCFRIMNGSLQSDICRLRIPDAGIGDVDETVMARNLPPHLRYACQYWVAHVRHSDNLLVLGDSILQFMQTHLLHWLEALSLLQRLVDGVEMLDSLESLVGNGKSLLQALTADAKRFLMRYRPIIQEAPLQVYTSVVFTPSASEVRRLFMDQRPPWLRCFPAAHDDWSQALHVMEGHVKAVIAVDFLPDGRLLASGSNDNTIRLWNARTGAADGTLEGHSDYVRAVAFSPDGRLLASGSADASVRLWNAKTGATRGILRGHVLWVAAVAFSPDGRLLASASHDKTIKLWDVQTAAVSSTLEVHTEPVLAVAFSPDGRLLASGAADNKVKLWDAGKAAVYGTLEGHARKVNAVAFSPDGQLLASASDDLTVRLWNAMSGAAWATLGGCSGVVSAVAFSPDGQLLASADGTIRLWDAKTGAAYGTISGHGEWALAVAFSPGGELLAAGGGSPHTVSIWSIGLETARGLWDRRSCARTHVERVAFSSDGGLLAAVSAQTSAIMLWDAKTGAKCGALEGHAQVVRTLAFAPEGHLLASGSADKSVRTWNAKTGEAFGVLQGHSDSTDAVAFSPDGQLLASGGYDGTIRFWNVKTGTTCAVLEGHVDGVRGLSFSPNGQLLASCAWDAFVRLWDAKTGAARGTLKGHRPWLEAVQFSPDSRLLATADCHSTVKLWDPISQQQVQEFRKCSRIHELTFSPSCKYLSTGTEHLLIHHLAEVSNCSFHLGVRNNWVTCNDRNLVWLPHELRPTAVKIHGSTIALGLSSGRVLFLSIDFEGTFPTGSHAWIPGALVR